MLTKEETWARLRALHMAYGEMPKGKWDLAGISKLGEYPPTIGADLDGVDLSNSYLGAAQIPNAILSNANLSGAELVEADLCGANLSGANLTDACLERAQCQEANLLGANLSKASLWFANFSGSDLRGANLCEADINETNMNLVNLSGADITGSTFWGVSTAGWKIDGIKADYVYFCKSNETKKEKYRRTFQKGQFEALFKSLPTVELIFVEGLSPTSLYALSMIIEKINQQNPRLGIKMADVRKNEFETRIGVKVKKDEQLMEAGQLINEAVSQAICSIPVNIFPPNIHEVLETLPHRQHSSIVVNMVQPIFQFVKADGSTLSSSILQVGTIQSSTDVIVTNYSVHKEELDALFGRLKNSFSDYESSTRKVLTENTDRLIEAIQNGKEIDAIQMRWEEIKEGVKTGGAAMTIAATIGRLLGFM